MDDRKVFVGVMRPTINTVKLPEPRSHWCKVCNQSLTGDMTTTPMSAIQKHINSGCFDTPVYATVDEIIDRVAQKIIEKEMA